MAENANSTPAPGSRRGFLRGLASLPLIGGSVALIGSPVAAAEAPTPLLLESYNAWLHYERRILAGAMYPAFGSKAEDYVPLDNPGGYFHFAGCFNKQRAEREVQARAAVILAAAGCSWDREDGR